MRMATTSSENSWEEERDGEGEEAEAPGREKENNVSLYSLACVANSVTTKQLPHVNNLGALPYHNLLCPLPHNLIMVQTVT